MNTGGNKEVLFTIPCMDKMMNGLYQIEIVNKIVSILIIAISLIMIIVVQNQPNMLMYFRRAEFGYLQLFEVEASRIKKQVALENVIKAVISIVIADIVCLILMMIAKISYNICCFTCEKVTEGRCNKTYERIVKIDI